MVYNLKDDDDTKARIRSEQRVFQSIRKKGIKNVHKKTFSVQRESRMFTRKLPMKVWSSVSYIMVARLGV